MTIALLAAALLGAAPVPSPLEGCKAVPGTHSWQYKCDGLMAAINDSDTGHADSERIVDSLTEEIAKAYGGTSGRSRERWSIEGRERSVVRLEFPERQAAMVVVALRRSEGTRVLMCGGKETERCRAVFDLLAAAPWRSAAAPGTKALAPAKATLAGRPVQAPEGCREEPQTNGARISCGPYFVHWGNAPDESFADGMVDALERVVVEAAPSQKIRRDTVPCRLASVGTTCRRVTAEFGDGDKVTCLVGWVHVGEEIVFAGCMVPGETGAARPCSLVFDLK
jgi:hypothetical protein